MANFWYGKGVQHFVNGDVNYASNTIKVALVAATYTAAPSTDEFFSVAVTSTVSAGVTLGTKTNVLGLISAANTTWTSVSGSQITQLVGYVAGGSPGTNDYILFNLNVGTNMPVTPNGGNITASWDAVNGIGTLMAGLTQRERGALGKLWDRIKWGKSDGGVLVPAFSLFEPTIILG